MPFPWKVGRARRRIGIALGGGGVRGLAHIGVLQVLAEAGVRATRAALPAIGALQPSPRRARRRWWPW